jgi:hypothetical protein
MGRERRGHPSDLPSLVNDQVTQLHPSVDLIQEFIFLPVESFQAIDNSHTSPGIMPHPNSTSNSDQDVQAEIFAMHDKITVLVDKCDHLHT